MMMWLMMAIACAPKQEITVGLGPIPEVGERSEFVPLVPEIGELQSGARLWVVEDDELPVAIVRVLLPGGSATDGEAWGRADIAAQMLTEAAGARTSLELAGELRLQASGLWATAGRHTTEIGFSGHVDRLEEGLPLLADIIYRPSFLEDDWDRIIDQQIQSHRQLMEDGSGLARAFDQYFLYGSNHPLGTPHSGIPSTVQGLDRESTAAWHQARLVASEVDIVVVGALSLEEATALLDAHLSIWPGESYVPPEIPELDVLPGEGQLLLLDMPGAQQTAIRVLSRAYASGDPMAPAAELAGIALGGSFTSRLNNLLRETRGYTYGAGCSFYDTRNGGMFSASTNVRTDATAPAMIDLNNVLVEAITGFDADELTKAQGQYRNDAIEQGASRSSIAGALSGLMALDRPPDSFSADLVARLGVSLEEMNAAAPLAIPERGLTILVGDESVIGEPLRSAGIDYMRIELPE